MPAGDRLSTRPIPASLAGYRQAARDDGEAGPDMIFDDLDDALRAFEAMNPQGGTP